MLLFHQFASVFFFFLLHSFLLQQPAYLFCFLIFSTFKSQVEIFQMVKSVLQRLFMYSLFLSLVCIETSRANILLVVFTRKCCTKVMWHNQSYSMFFQSSRWNISKMNLDWCKNWNFRNLYSQ